MSQKSSLFTDPFWENWSKSKLYDNETGKTIVKDAFEKCLPSWPKRNMAKEQDLPQPVTRAQISNAFDKHDVHVEWVDSFGNVESPKEGIDQFNVVIFLQTVYHGHGFGQPHYQILIPPTAGLDNCPFLRQVEYIEMRNNYNPNIPTGERELHGPIAKVMKDNPALKAFLPEVSQLRDAPSVAAVRISKHWFHKNKLSKESWQKAIWLPEYYAKKMTKRALTGLKFVLEIHTEILRAKLRILQTPTISLTVDDINSFMGIMDLPYTRVTMNEEQYEIMKEADRRQGWIDIRIVDTNIQFAYINVPEKQIVATTGFHNETMYDRLELPENLNVRQLQWILILIDESPKFFKCSSEYWLWIT